MPQLLLTHCLKLVPENKEIVASRKEKLKLDINLVSIELDNRYFDVDAIYRMFNLYIDSLDINDLLKLLITLLYLQFSCF